MIAVASIVVVLLIALASPVGASVKENVLGLVNKFTDTTETLTNNMSDSVKNLHNSIMSDISNNDSLIDININTEAFLEMYNEIIFTSVTEGATWQNLIDAGTTLTLTNGNETVTIYFTSDNGVACVNAVETEIYGGESTQLVTYNDVSYDFVSVTDEIVIGTSYNIYPE